MGLFLCLELYRIQIFQAEKVERVGPFILGHAVVGILDTRAVLNYTYIYFV